MSIENQPRYQGLEAGQQKQKNQTKRLTEKNEQQRADERLKLETLQKLIEQEQERLISLIESELEKAKREGREFAELISPNGKNFYHFKKMSENKIIASVTIVLSDDKDELTTTVTSSYVLNKADMQDNIHEIFIAVFDVQDKIVSKKKLDPEKDKDRYNLYDKILPSLRKVKEDIEEKQKEKM